MVAMMDKFGWRNIAVIHDHIGPNVRNNRRIVQFCHGQLVELRARIGNIRHLEISMYSASEDVISPLLATKVFSRSSYLFS